MMNEHEAMRRAAALVARPELIHYIGLGRRIGVRSFITFLEYQVFTPDTPANDLYHLTVVRWPFDEPAAAAIYFVVSIPKTYIPDAERLLALLGLRAANGIPMMLDATHRTIRDARKFEPFNTESCFTLEHAKPGHFAYHNNPQLNKTAEQLEDEACKQVIAKHLAGYKEQAGGINTRKDP